MLHCRLSFFKVLVVMTGSDKHSDDDEDNSDHAKSYTRARIQQERQKGNEDKDKHEKGEDICINTTLERTA